jgi:hypothetical protein
MSWIVRMTAGGLMSVGTLWLAGCGGASGAADRPEVLPVSGTVTYAGQPMAGATVTFKPEEAGQPSAFGKTDAQGRFRLTTFVADDGAVPGSHTVTVQKYTIVAPDVNEDDPDYDSSKVKATPPKSHLPEKYSNPKTSGLTARVSAGENDVKLDLTD